MNSVFIFSHQDDEIGIFETLNKSIQNKENIIIFYMTSGEVNKSISTKKIFHRDKESLSVLRKFGIKEKNIIFFGRKNNIRTCALHKKLNFSYKELSNFLSNIKGDIKIYTHAYEGGNEDHDSCFILVLKLFKKLKNIKSAYQFPFYNAYSRLFYYSVQKPLKINGEVIKVKVSLKNKIRYISYLFFYKSQTRVWVGLYPFLIFNFLIRNYYYLQRINKKFLVKKPHNGILLYERFRNSKFQNLRLNFLNFLK